MIIRLLPLLLLLVSALTKSAIAATTPVRTLACIQNGKKATLRFVKEKEVFELAEFDFVPIGVYDGEFSCARWLNLLYEKASAKVEKISAVHYSTTKNEVGRLDGATRFAIYDFCENSEFCRLKFPFNWRLSDFTFWRKTKPTRTNETRGICFDKPQQWTKKNKRTSVDLETKVYKDVGVDSFWYTPQNSFADKIIDITKSLKNETVVISTMTMSLRELAKIKEHFATRQIKAYIVADLEIWLNSEFSDTKKLFTMIDDNFQLIPAFKTPSYYQGAHHIKGAVVVSENPRYLFTSANLTSTEEGRFKEFGIAGHNAKFAGDLFASIASKIFDYCQENDRLECLMNQYYDKYDRQNFKAAEILNHACYSFLEDKNLRTTYLKYIDNNSFLAADEYDLNEVINGLVKNAKTTVEGTVHQVSSTDFLTTLEEARARKLSVSVVVGDAEILPNYSPAQNTSPWPELTLATDETWRPHTKALAFDRDLLFWGTGNFTKTGLTNPREIFTLISDPKVVNEFRQFYRSFAPKTTH